MVSAIGRNYFITFTYHRQVTRNLELCRQTLESWTRKYPRDLIAHGFLSGFTSPGTGHYERAVEEGQKAIELDPDFAIGYENVAFAYLYLNRLPEAEALLHKASERKIEVVQFSLLRYFIAFLRNDKAAMEREMTQRRVKLEAQGWFEHQEAMTLAYQGRLKEANRLSARAVSLARQGGLLGRAAMFQGARGGVECVVRESGGGAKKRGSGVVAFPKPGCRLWTCFCACASGRFRASPSDRGGTRKALPGGYVCPVQLSACAAGARGAQPG